MSARHEFVRRIAFWVALCTGLVLVSLQFACMAPQSFKGFPHASRRVEPTPAAKVKDSLTEADAAKDAKASLYWTPQRAVARSPAQTLTLVDDPAPHVAAAKPKS